MLGNYLPTTVYAVENLVEDVTPEVVLPWYTFTTNPDVGLQEEIPRLLEGFDIKNYTVQQPVKFFRYTEVELKEEAYYPVMVNQQLVAFIYYNQEREDYFIEKSEAIDRIGRFRLSSTQNQPLIFMSIENQVIGRTKDDVIKIFRIQA